MAAHGGAREGAGRKRIADPARAVTIKLKREPRAELERASTEAGLTYAEILRLGIAAAAELASMKGGA